MPDHQEPQTVHPPQQRPQRPLSADLARAFAFLFVLAGGILVGGFVLMAVRSTPAARMESPPLPTAVAVPLEVASGPRLYSANCASCHGIRGQGQPRMGSPLRSSKFVLETDDSAMLRFLKQGRQPDDPQSVMNGYMPPRGGNPTLTDAELNAIIHHMRQMTPSSPGGAAATVNAN